MYVQGSGATAVPITEAGDLSINVDFDEVADPAFGDSWESRLKGLLRFSGQIAGNYDTAQGGNAVWEGAVASTSRKAYFYPDASVLTNYYYGNIFPKLSVSGSVSDKGKFSGSFNGDGQLALKP